MPYTCKVVGRVGAAVTLSIEPEQPDCEPFYTGSAFALGLITECDVRRGAINDEVDLYDLDALAMGEIDPSPYVQAVEVVVTRMWDRDTDTLPVARYTIRTTDARWLEHMEVGDLFESYAYDNAPAAAWLDNGA